jgi:hypothetical protein
METMNRGDISVNVLLYQCSGNGFFSTMVSTMVSKMVGKIALQSAGFDATARELLCKK